MNKMRFWMSNLSIRNKLLLLLALPMGMLMVLSVNLLWNHFYAASDLSNLVMIQSASAFALVASVFLAWLVISSLTASLGQLMRFSEAVVAGDVEVDSQSNIGSDEIGQVMQVLEKVRETMLTQQAQAKRIHTALDQTSTAVMMADEDYHITYMNQAVTQMFEKNEAALRSGLPDFDASKIIGSHIDSFHKNPAHQRSMLNGLKHKHEANIEVAGIHFSFMATPILNDSNENLGVVVEWLDRTEDLLKERQLEQEVTSVVDAAKRGDLSQRVKLDGLDGVMISLSESLNDLLDTTEMAVNDTIDGLKALENGQLDYRISNDYDGLFDTIKQSNNHTSQKLNELISTVSLSTQEVLQGSREISESNMTLSDRTQQQAASLEEIAASIEEVSSTISGNADNAGQGNLLASEARHQAEEGFEVVKNAIVAMDDISQSSHKIANIIGVIDDIAFQTNLLALNAAVEAARAGDQGRGFAVVAAEVRALAQRSSGAAKEIKDLINESVNSVDMGKKLVDQSGESLQTILLSSGKVRDIIAEIAAASREQSLATEQVSTAVSQMDSVTQQNAAMVEETAAASQALDESASSLEQLVGQFNLGSKANETQLNQAKLEASQDLLRINRQASMQVARAPKKKQKAAQAVESDAWAEF